MLNNIKTLVRKIVLGYDISTYYFAQGGEDAILQGIFSKKLNKKEKGFYVDVGAYHPYKASNTFLFYLNGWNGINIDPRPGCMKSFNQIRKRDINLETGIGGKEETLTYYYISDNSSMNSFSKEYLTETGMYNKVKEQIPVKVYPLKNILEEHKTKFSEIDFLTIDVEGRDLEVVKSNDWNQFRPKVIVVELNCRTIEDINSNPTAQFLCGIGYNVIAKNVILPNVASVFFADKGFDY